MMGSVANMYQNGESVVILGETDWSHGGDKIIIKKDVTLASQKGKFIGIYANEPSVTFFVNKYLASQGLKLSDFKLAKMDPDVLSDQFIAGRLSMIVTFDPDALRAEREGNGKVVATSADYPGCLPEGIFGYRQVVEGIPAADLEKILLGWIRAVEWTKNPANWKEYQQILNQYTFAGSGPFSEADLKGMMAAVLIHDRATIQQRNQPGGGLSQYLNELKTFMSQNGLLKKEFTPAELLNTQPLLNALKK
jgi:NitT/TauT family transport system substrate-binding protein